MDAILQNQSEVLFILSKSILILDVNKTFLAAFVHTVSSLWTSDYDELEMPRLKVPLKFTIFRNLSLDF